MTLSEHASSAIEDLTPTAIKLTNELTRGTFRTRGGRIGSGMGLLLESLWGYFVNQQLDELGEPYEIGWIATHEYNDFACLRRDVQWDAATRAGELLRIEIKSMVASADESKGHFDRLVGELEESDLLIVLLWDWEELDAYRSYPKILDYFVGSALEVAKLRDVLHVARGGSFVVAGACPDCVGHANCTHVGEPLNAKGKRERLSGPLATKPANVQYAANFGGLKRMLGVRGNTAREQFRNACAECAGAQRYADFIANNFSSRADGAGTA